MNEAIETANFQGVSMFNGGLIVVMMPKTRMTNGEALLHAAWLVSLAETSEGEFAAVLEAVRNT